MSEPSPSVSHLEVLVEEPSMEAFLNGFLPRLLGERPTFAIHPFGGKDDLLQSLPRRLRAYAKWLPRDRRVVVVLDRDKQDCRELKEDLETIAAAAGFATRTTDPRNWRVVNRIVIEELEAWYFGDWEAVRRVYPRVSDGTPRKQAFRDPDAIKGGTWEALERELKRAGYFRGGLRKIEIARALGAELSVGEENRSTSFRHFREALRDAASG